MVSQKIIISNPSGIHARPAAELVKEAKFCESDVYLVHGEKKINPKSILNLMSAGLAKGTEILVTCDGETEEADLKRIVDAINGGLGEL